MAMMQVDITKIETLRSQVKSFQKKTEQEITEVLKGIAISAFEYILEETPQWTGKMVESTRINLNRIDYSGTDPTALRASGRSDMGKPMVNPSVGGQSHKYQRHFARKQKGDQESIANAKTANAGKLDGMTVNDTVIISNNVKGQEDTSYASFVENDRNAKGASFLRAVNRPSGMYANAATHFGNLGQLSEADMAHFRSKKL